MAYGTISAKHAGMFIAFSKNADNKFLLNDIIKGEKNFPDKPEDRDSLYFLAQSFRAKLLHDLPTDKKDLGRWQSLNLNHYGSENNEIQKTI